MKKILFFVCVWLGLSEGVRALQPTTDSSTTLLELSEQEPGTPDTPGASLPPSPVSRSTHDVTTNLKRRQSKSIAQYKAALQELEAARVALDACITKNLEVLTNRKKYESAVRRRDPLCYVEEELFTNLTKRIAQLYKEIEVLGTMIAERTAPTA